MLLDNIKVYQKKDNLRNNIKVNIYYHVYY